MKIHPKKHAFMTRHLLLLALLLSIPAFYLALTAIDSGYRNLGRILYCLVAAILWWDLSAQLKRSGRRLWHVWPSYGLEIVIGLGAVISALRADADWTDLEWLLRLSLCTIIFLRLSFLLSKYVRPNRLTLILTLAVFMLAIAGGGFYWLEPDVHSYADGIWLAFTTISTVGYGDIVPSSPAARIFAIFMVLLGYALFSIVTASISALFVGEDEKRLERELHADIRALREEVAALRDDLRRSQNRPE